MGKKKKTVENVVVRNPDDFLNDLKFIRKNREKKAAQAEQDDKKSSDLSQDPQNSQRESANEKEQKRNLPVFFKNVQKSIKEKKILKATKAKKLNPKPEISKTIPASNNQNEIQSQQRWLF